MEDLFQLDFDFDAPTNRLLTNLAKGDFITFFEVNTPSKNSDFKASVDFLRSMDAAVRKVRGINTGLAVTDKMESVDSWNIADFASAGLAKSTLDRNIIYISGKKSKASEISDTVKRCSSLGLRNIIPVTGDGYPDEIEKNAARNPCFDSTQTLKAIKGLHEADVIFPGCVVNPFKYTPSDIFPQYFKLVKKVNFGSKFIVTQAGWDMMKLQELRWFLDLRELHYPTLSRIILLTPELVESILNGKYPGVHMSRDFQMILENEKKYGFKQFASAQWRRLQLQVAGCRLLGYSGVQIAGVERPEHIATVADRIKKALKEFKDLSSWQQAYSDHISRSDMAPFEHRFYLYKNLFRGSLHSTPEVNPEGIPNASIFEKMHYLLCKSMFSRDHLLAPGEHRLTKKLLVGCSSCNYCRLPMTHYICPETCPKGLSNGPCGGSRIDGRCELNQKQCIHIRRTRIAAWLNEIDVLEERYIKHPDIASKLKQ
jgi:methylenetetrahydrofolate reductase (NADPH)